MNTATVAQAPQRTSWWMRQRAHWREAFGHQTTTASEIELVQRRIYVLPSMRGWAVIAIAIILLLVGVNYQLSLAYVVAFLLGGLMQVALHATYRNLRGLIVRVGKSPRCVAGETLYFPLTIASPERAREGVAISRLGHATRKQNALNATNAERLRVAADAQATYTLAVSAPARGVFSLGRMLIESRAPYGVIRAWSYAHFDWVGLVEPKPEQPYPDLPHATGADNETQRRTDVAHDPDSLREYAPGDSLKRVAWKQVAKSGEWYTRTGESGQRGEVELSWTTTNLSDVEARLSRLAAWIDRARNENAAFSLTVPNAQLPLSDSAPHHDEALAVLAVYPKSLSEVAGVRG
jgi:uncharacterized protein (DUF58 family)